MNLSSKIRIVNCKVKNKSWFGVLNVLRLMVQDWAVLRVASEAIIAAGIASQPQMVGRGLNGRQMYY